MGAGRRLRADSRGRRPLRRARPAIAVRRLDETVERRMLICLLAVISVDKCSGFSPDEMRTAESAEGRRDDAFLRTATCLNLRHAKILVAPRRVYLGGGCDSALRRPSRERASPPPSRARTGRLVAVEAMIFYYAGCQVRSHLLHRDQRSSRRCPTRRGHSSLIVFEIVQNHSHHRHKA
jgi:hypothetical protein